MVFRSKASSIAMALLLSSCGAGPNPLTDQADLFATVQEESSALTKAEGEVSIPSEFFLRALQDPSKVLHIVEPDTSFRILGRESGLRGGGEAAPDLETDFYRVKLTSGPYLGAEGYMRALYLDDSTLNGSDSVYAMQIDPETQIPQDFKSAGSLLHRKKYKKLADKVHRNSSISKDALYAAYEFLRRNREKFRTTAVLSVIDFSLSSRVKRMAVLDLQKQKYRLYRVAHGKGSDRNHDGVVEKLAYDFSKDRRKKRFVDSHMSQIGFIKIAGVGRRSTNRRKYLALIGLERNLNNSLVEREIIIHDDWGQNRRKPDGYMSRALPGRSLGCVTTTHKKLPSVISRTKDGTLLYAYSSMLKRYKRHKEYVRAFRKRL